ncbi:MAG: hypothetical protein ACK5CE_19965 [Actinomycetes bacterium]|jgi:hypothetical protein
MKFFVPNADPNDPDGAAKLYTALAEFAGRSPAGPGKRICSIEYRNDGVWTATVGQTLSGYRTKKVTRKGKRTEANEKLSDRAVVQAIFADAPFLVVTDARPLTDKGSAWENPFMAGVPTSITYFED